MDQRPKGGPTFASILKTVNCNLMALIKDEKDWKDDADADADVNSVGGSFL